MKKSRIFRQLKEERGSDVVSFVIMVPLLIFIFAMMMTFSQIIYAGSVALNAANAGCRQAIICDTEQEARKAAVEAATYYVSGTGMGVHLSPMDPVTLDIDGSWERGDICTCYVTVVVRTAIPMQYQYGSLQKKYVLTKTCPMMIERSGQ